MKKLLVIVLVVILWVSPVFGEQRYNAMEGRWETVPGDWEIEYNPFEDDWSYQPEDSEIEYNPFKDSWDWDSGNNSYDDYDKDEWEY